MVDRCSSWHFSFQSPTPAIHTPVALENCIFHSIKNLNIKSFPEVWFWGISSIRVWSVIILRLGGSSCAWWRPRHICPGRAPHSSSGSAWDIVPWCVAPVCGRPLIGIHLIRIHLALRHPLVQGAIGTCWRHWKIRQRAGIDSWAVLTLGCNGIELGTGFRWIMPTEPCIDSIHFFHYLLSNTLFVEDNSPCSYWRFFKDGFSVNKRRN